MKKQQTFRLALRYDRGRLETACLSALFPEELLPRHYASDLLLDRKGLPYQRIMNQVLDDLGC